MHDIRLEHSFLAAAQVAKEFAKDKNQAALVFRLEDFCCAFSSPQETTRAEAISTVSARFNIGEYSYSNSSEADPRWREDEAIMNIPDNEIFGEE